MVYRSVVTCDIYEEYMYYMVRCSTLPLTVSYKATPVYDIAF